MKNEQYLENIKEAARYLKEKYPFSPTIGIVLGTGLGNLATEIEVKHAIDYADIPHFPVSTVESHQGKLLFGELSGKQIVAMQGRFHHYEGYTMKQVTFPIRVLNELGIDYLFLSNAAGGVTEGMEMGDIMVLDDHINLQTSNPLTGPNLDELGPRFPDMSEPYNKELIDKAIKFAQDKAIACWKGTYVSLPGPNLETKAEYRFIHVIGGDAIGMSTVPEVIVANHMGLKVFAASIISNIGFPPEKVVKTKIEDVIREVKAAEPNLTEMFKFLITGIEQ